MRNINQRETITVLVMSGKRKFSVKHQRLLDEIAQKRKNFEEKYDIKLEPQNINAPEDYDLHHQPLFSLPPEIIRPILAANYPRYQRLMAKRRKEGMK